MIKTLISLCILCLLMTVQVQAESAGEIVKQADLKMRGQSSYTEITMQIIRPGWTRSMSMKAWTKDQEYSLVLVTAPAQDKGSSSLKRHKEMWNWVPNIERIIKIAPSMLGQSWMGSDFTNDDLINQSSIVVDYTHKLLKEEQFDGTSCWVIEATPKPDAPVVWGKQVIWISHGEYNMRKVEYYDEFDELINTMSTFAVKTLGGRNIPTRQEMQPADKPDQKTVLLFHKAQFDFDLPTSFFSQQNMRDLKV
ncbi:MAG: outer membrane lipoprotein-sorting protein [Deltaproteobacteria bacterium]|nr:outer membrane lipoprotein-sorting protein [Deltaproteobacteria bacterium]MBW2613670.1 outer membrane lipoprotein-sorting protein [Deltaproteobacteria bacterium]MBW2676128.1 outer membrane lipoprotein-sorting protein [Deltaproteobacteria bacterium]